MGGQYTTDDGITLGARRYTHVQGFAAECSVVKHAAAALSGVEEVHGSLLKGHACDHRSIDETEDGKWCGIHGVVKRSLNQRGAKEVADIQTTKSKAVRDKECEGEGVVDDQRWT